MKTLKDAFLDELRDMYDAEHRIIKALPKLADAATCARLKAAFLDHLEETKGQVTKLEQVFQAFEEEPKSKKCKATVGLIDEGDEIASDNKDEPTINAALISAPFVNFVLGEDQSQFSNVLPASRRQINSFRTTFADAAGFIST